mmetsp:Transcript_159125/g.296508  ORF Transcript_159125/g.296508 Transcript_159125/m.296508 type:complete len:1096 (-) Transcript_159125:121-3408(-)
MEVPMQTPQEIEAHRIKVERQKAQELEEIEREQAAKAEADEAEETRRLQEKQREFQAQIARMELETDALIAEFSNQRKSTLEKWNIGKELADVSRLYHEAAELRAQALVKVVLTSDVMDGMVRLLALKSVLSILQHGKEEDMRHRDESGNVLAHHERSHPTEGLGVELGEGMITGSGANRMATHTGPIGGFSISFLHPASRTVVGMVELTRDTFLPVRRHAVRGLAMIGDKASQSSYRLATMALEERDTRLRIDCIRALHSFGYGALNALYMVLESTHWPTKIEACRALAELTDWQEAKPCQEILEVTLRLTELLEDRDEDVRKAACYTLGHMSVKSIARVPKLAVMLRDRHTRVRAAAAWALAEIGYAYETLEEGERTMADDTEIRENDAKWNAWQKGHLGLKMMLELSGTATLTDVICRSLTAVIREENPFGSYMHDASEDEHHEGIKRIPNTRAAADDHLWTPRSHGPKFYDAIDRAFERLGTVCLEPLCSRLKATEDGGYSSRMAVMRSLSATNLMSLPVIASFVAEWILMEVEEIANERPVAPQSMSVEEWSRHLPLTYEAKLLEHGTTDQVSWALIKREKGAAVLGFCVRPTDDLKWMHEDFVKFNPMDIYDENGKVVGQVNVHSGFYDMTDKCFGAICLAIRRSATADGLNRLNCLCICGGGIGGSIAQVMTLRLLCEKAPLGEMRLPLAPDQSDAHFIAAAAQTPPSAANTPPTADPGAVTGTNGEAAAADAGASPASPSAPPAAWDSERIPSETRTKANGKSKPQPPASLNGAPPALDPSSPVSSEKVPDGVEGAPDQAEEAEVPAAASNAFEEEEDPKTARNGGITCVTFGAVRVMEYKKHMPDEAREMLEAKRKVYCNSQSSAFIFSQDPLPHMLSARQDLFAGIKKTTIPAGICRKRKKPSKYAAHHDHYEQGGQLWAHKYGPLFKEVALECPEHVLQKALCLGEVRYGEFNEAVSRMEVYVSAMCWRMEHLFFDRDEHYAELSRRRAEQERKQCLPSCIDPAGGHHHPKCPHYGYMLQDHQWVQIPQEIEHRREPALLTKAVSRSLTAASSFLHRGHHPAPHYDDPQYGFNRTVSPASSTHA